MEEITIRGTRAQRNLMEWSQRVADCRSSGLSVARWCSEHNVKPKTYYNWQKMVQQEFELDPFTNTLFLFCGRRRDRIKGLYWEGDGFILLYKRLERGVSTSGPETSRRRKKSRRSSTAGLWKG